MIKMILHCTAIDKSAVSNHVIIMFAHLEKSYNKEDVRHTQIQCSVI